MKRNILFYLLVLLFAACGKSDDAQIIPDDPIDGVLTGKIMKQIEVNGTKL